MMGSGSLSSEKMCLTPFFHSLGRISEIVKEKRAITANAAA